MKSHLPEEKLLHLIREKSSGKQLAAPKKAAPKPLQGSGRSWVGVFNGMLVLVLVALSTFFAYRIFLEPKPDHSLLALSSEKPLENAETPLVVEKEIKPLVYYQGQLAKRDLFERPLAQVAANASVDLTKRYKLVGIVLGKPPEAIVEDLTNKTTMFVHEGEWLESVQVKTIEEGRVVFLQEGLEIELKQ